MPKLSGKVSHHSARKRFEVTYLILHTHRWYARTSPPLTTTSPAGIALGITPTPPPSWDKPDGSHAHYHGNQCVKCSTIGTRIAPGTINQQRSFTNQQQSLHTHTNSSTPMTTTQQYFGPERNVDAQRSQLTPYLIRLPTRITRTFRADHQFHGLTGETLTTKLSNPTFATS